jgi:hypothetical protein
MTCIGPLVKGLLTKLTLFSACSGAVSLSLFVVDKEDGPLIYVFGARERCTNFKYALE